MMSWVLFYFILCFIGLFVFRKIPLLHKYCLNSLVALDQLVNACVLFGDPDETISSRAHKGRLRGNKLWAILANFLDKLDRGHSEDSVEWDEGSPR